MRWGLGDFSAGSDLLLGVVLLERDLGCLVDFDFLAEVVLLCRESRLGLGLGEIASSKLEAS